MLNKPLLCLRTCSCVAALAHVQRKKRQTACAGPQDDADANADTQIHMHMLRFIILQRKRRQTAQLAHRMMLMVAVMPTHASTNSCSLDSSSKRGTLRLVMCVFAVCLPPCLCVRFKHSHLMLCTSFSLYATAYRLKGFCACYASIKHTQFNAI